MALTAPASMTLTITADDWRDQSACRDTDPDLFFPVGTTGPAIEQIRSAKEVCEACEVRQPCLDYALRTNQHDGVWGGTTPTHRRKMKPETLVCADCWGRFPFHKRDQVRCEPCQERHRRREQSRWHHEVGKFRAEAS